MGDETNTAQPDRTKTYGLLLKDEFALSGGTWTYKTKRRLGVGYQIELPVPPLLLPEKNQQEQRKAVPAEVGVAATRAALSSLQNTTKGANATLITAPLLAALSGIVIGLLNGKVVDWDAVAQGLTAFSWVLIIIATLTIVVVAVVLLAAGTVRRQIAVLPSLIELWEHETQGLEQTSPKAGGT